MLDYHLALLVFTLLASFFSPLDLKTLGDSQIRFWPGAHFVPSSEINCSLILNKCVTAFVCASPSASACSLILSLLLRLSPDRLILHSLELYTKRGQVQERNVLLKWFEFILLLVLVLPISSSKSQRPYGEDFHFVIFTNQIQRCISHMYSHLLLTQAVVICANRLKLIDSCLARQSKHSNSVVQLTSSVKGSSCQSHGHVRETQFGPS